MATQNQVQLTVPAQPEFLRVVRVTAAGLTSRLGFGIDEVDDLKLALDELCFALIGPKGISGDQQLEIRYIVNGNSLQIFGSVKIVKDGEPVSLNELSQQILPVLVDEHRLWQEGDTASFSLTKAPGAGIQ